MKLIKVKKGLALLLAACGFLVALGSGNVWAQWKPDRTAELIVSAGPGGNQDLTARVI